MTTSQQITQDQTGAAHDAEMPGHRGYLRYLLWGLVIPAIGWLAAFPLVCSRSYEQWGETQWGPVLEFPYAANTPDADVVVFGDSSAFLGIDPRLINAQLGIRSVVLPSTVGSLPVIGDAPLRSYLSRHKQPKLVVLYFSAWNLDFSHTAPGRLFEGEEMMLRHGGSGEAARFWSRRPLELIAFPFRLYSTFGSKMLLDILHHRSRAEAAAGDLGHAPYLEPFGPLENLCRIPSAYLQNYGSRTVEELRQKYQTPGTQVMIYLAPMPNCTNSGAIHDRSFAALDAVAPVLLPPTDFAGDVYYTHIRPPYVPVASAVFAQALKQRLEQVDPSLLGAAPPGETPTP